MQITEHFSLKELTRSETGRRLGLQNVPSAAEKINADLRVELNRLREYAARKSGRRNLPTTTPSASASDGEEAAKGWQLFGKCASEYAGMAEVADQQRNDLAEWQAYGQTVVESEK